MSSSLQPHGYTVHGILQARILEWVAIPFSKGSSQPRDQTQVSCIAGRFFTSWATREVPSEDRVKVENSTSGKCVYQASALQSHCVLRTKVSVPVLWSAPQSYRHQALLTTLLPTLLGPDVTSVRTLPSSPCSFHTPCPYLRKQSLYEFSSNYPIWLCTCLLPAKTMVNTNTGTQEVSKRWYLIWVLKDEYNLIK